MSIRIDPEFSASPEEMDRLFKVFEQTESGRKSRAGTGLGLRYVRADGDGISPVSPPRPAASPCAGTAGEIRRLAKGYDYRNIIALIGGRGEP